jgi:hypothetical protein
LAETISSISCFNCIDLNVVLCPHFWSAARANKTKSSEHLLFPSVVSIDSDERALFENQIGTNKM